MSKPTLDVVIPVLNEAHVLERSVATVRAFLLSEFDYDWRIVIVDNGSTDGTDAVARRLCESNDRLLFHHMEQKGRGRALRLAWLQSSADAVCYMDVDLSTNLRHLKQLASALFEEGYDVVTGSRLLPESRIRRSATREFISRVYNWLVRLMLP
ncbi:MAG: glycosyltransferase [Acidobacteria bacterium]|nr:glycosyltransferase [Acidobacteriota bacterium]